MIEYTEIIIDFTRREVVNANLVSSDTNWTEVSIPRELNPRVREREDRGECREKVASRRGEVPGRSAPFITIEIRTDRK